MCPLLPCFERFQNLEFCLQHLLDCPKLSGASYWCPFHRHHESFAPPGPSRDGKLRSSASSRLKRLMTFVKRFGRNDSVDTGTSMSLPSNSAAISPRGFVELSSTSISWPCKSVVFSETNGTPRPYKLGSANLCEPGDCGLYHCYSNSNECRTTNQTCDASTDNSRNEVSNGPQLFELSSGPQLFEFSSGPQLFELSDRRQTECRWSVESFANDAPQVRYIEDFNRDNLVVSPLSDFSSPNRTLTTSPLSARLVSPVAEVISEQATRFGQSPKMETPTTNPRSDLTSSLTHQHIDYHQPESSQRRNILDLVPRSFRIDRDPSEQILTATTEVFFEVLREHVNALNQEWMSQLILSHGPDVRFGLSTAFEKGIQSLQDFYCGTLPRTFQDTFALMHVVHACAWIYHKEDGPDFWRTLFLDVLQWHYAIATEADTRLFVEVAFLLWSVPDSSVDESVAEATGYSNDFLSQVRRSPPEIHTELGNISSYCFNFNYSQQSTMQASDPSLSPSFRSLDLLDLLRLRDVLKEGQTINLCSRYLDGKLELTREMILIRLELRAYRFRLCKDLCTCC